MSSVVQDWVGQACTWKQQTVLLCSLRGCDGSPKEDASKKLTRQIRRLVLHSASDPGKDKFMEAQEMSKVVTDVAEDLDHYPVHWVMHSIHAFEILAYKHPNVKARSECLNAYMTLVNALHLRIESEEDLDRRLADDNGRIPTKPQDVFPVTIERIREVEVTRVRDSGGGGGGYRG